MDSSYQQINQITELEFKTTVAEIATLPDLMGVAIIATNIIINIS